MVTCVTVKSHFNIFRKSFQDLKRILMLPISAKVISCIFKKWISQLFGVVISIKVITKGYEQLEGTLKYKNQIREKVPNDSLRNTVKSCKWNVYYTLYHFLLWYLCFWYFFLLCTFCIYSLQQHKASTFHRSVKRSNSGTSPSPPW
jgi:hypothetical protein